MPTPRSAFIHLIPWLLLVATPLAYSEPATKIKVESQADLPRHSYPIPGLASELVQAQDGSFEAFAAKVRTDVDAVLRDYDIHDRAALRGYIGEKLALREFAGEYPAALEMVEELRALEDKPSAKLTTGLGRVFLNAAIHAKGTSGPAFEQEFESSYRAAVEQLPWNVVQDWAKKTYASYRLFSKAGTLGYVMTSIDPAARESHALNDNDAATLIGIRNGLQFSPTVCPLVAKVLKQYIAEHDTAKPDIWAAREVTLTTDQKLTPVLVAIWDSGIDVSLYPDQVFDDPTPTVSGNHGLAYNDSGTPSTSWLYALTPEQQKRYPEVRDDIQGQQDIEEGHESPQSAALEQKLKTLSPEQMHQLGEIEKVIPYYMHGTHCAGIAVRGNPFARLVVARFNDLLPDLPFPPTIEWAQRMGADFQQMSDYFRTRNVRVVNMSWGDDRAEFETWLSKTGGGANPAERKIRANELYTVWRKAIEAAIKGAPGTLFVAAAGNSDSNTGFTEDVPSSLRLPNLMAVGAVNQSGDETSFSCYGKSVDVLADGYDVESFVPGGARLKLSGTSMASPNVVNLAAKLFALDPSLTPEQVIELIKQGGSPSQDGRRLLIDEKRSVALLLARQKK